MTSVPTTGAAEATTDATEWWADAVIYQVYPRSFADGNGDGMGDLVGVTERLNYLADLGVDAVWLSPFYTSPQADAGYDVADYRDVDPRFGTLADFDEMLSEAHDLGLKIIVDLVPNHTSDEHAWFQEALASPEGSAARERYIFRDGRGENGEEPPNNWQSIFGGPAWTRLQNDDGTPGQWYLHLFDTKQPDLNWENAEVRAEMEDVLRFWLDRGVDGFRVDVAHGMVKAEGLPDWSTKVAMVAGNENEEVAGDHFEGGAEGNAEGNMAPSGENTPPYFDQEGVHDIYRAWHRVLDEYDGDRMMVAEAWVEPMSRIFRYVRSDEMQQAFNFGFLLAGWDAARVHDNVAETLTEAAAVNAPATWVISNHDTVRHCTRYGLSDPTSFPKGIAAEDEQPDEELGLARGRAAALVMLGLPGSAYIYQGDELGLPEHTTLDASVRQDPSFFRTEGAERVRDGCRVPIPWEADAPAYGFSGDSPDAEPWLPQPESFEKYAADQQVNVAGSTYELYRQALSLRGQLDLGAGALEWTELNAPTSGILAYRNGKVQLVANMSGEPFTLPSGAGVLLVSDDAALTNDGDGTETLAPNAAVWLTA
ncbi:glycoside hydrolase family 13 protein [Zhihengliuella somnathii]